MDDNATPLDLDGLTVYTVGIIRLAESKGLTASWGKPHGNSRRLLLNGVGPHGTFGHVEIGRRSGKVLRATLVLGNGGRSVSAEGVAAVREVIGLVRKTYCTPDCTASSDSGCRP
jgi:hypothetical protein